ncbi:hypothetical protein CAMRE0001_2874 [Campylobacter rectus RM3267]|uniref:Uncharacterized protein n=1 Tax=Campylobacter rectus RM3267 TaxID=553218 RepID=B9D4T8_CAMRE|nr:hypothetical protein CAMRE0001_2874 [Campylobacter rectus RM3267]
MRINGANLINSELNLFGSRQVKFDLFLQICRIFERSKFCL